MATKDWKSKGINTLFRSWRRENPTGSVLVSNKYSDSLEGIDSVRQEGFLVSTFGDTTSNEERNVFKTKPEALRFARKYMRTH